MSITYTVSKRRLLGAAFMGMLLVGLALLLTVFWFGHVIAAANRGLALLIIASVYVELVGGTALIFGIALLLTAVLHTRGSIAIGENGLVLSNCFSTLSLPWEEALLYQSYNGYRKRRWSSLWDGSLVAFVALTSGKQKLLWPYLFPDFPQIMSKLGREMAARLFPRLIQSLNSGIAFGEISVNENELRVGQYRLMYKEIDEFVLDGDSVNISYKHTAMPCRSGISLKFIPNICILFKVLRHLGVQVRGVDSAEAGGSQG